MEEARWHQLPGPPLLSQASCLWSSSAASPRGGRAWSPYRLPAPLRAGGGAGLLSRGPVGPEPTAFWAVEELFKKPVSLSFFKNWRWGSGRDLCLLLVFSLSLYKLCFGKNAMELDNGPFRTWCITNTISCHGHNFLLSWLWWPRDPICSLCCN